MSKLMPKNNDSAVILDEKLSETLFGSSADFVKHYNSGLINKQAEEVVGILNEVLETYKNVKLQGKTIVFVSQSQIELNEVFNEVSKWNFWYRIWETVSELVSDGTLNDNDLVGFANPSTGSLMKVENEDGQDVFVNVSNERLYRSSEENLLEMLAMDGSEDEYGAHVFRVSDVLGLNFDFIHSVHSAVMENSILG